MDIYEWLGVKKLINACGPVTRIGGSRMPAEVVAAMAEANNAFVDLDELQEKAGARIAEIVGVEAACVTAGAAAGLAVAAAACMAGADPAKARQLPDTTGMRNEVLVLRCHRTHYDQAVRLAGARLVEVGFADFSTLEDLDSAAGANTAAILYLAKGEKAAGSLPLGQVIAVAHANKLPVIVDAADELPPASNLHRFTDAGADLVLFSGGKDLRGPQGSGLALGTAPLIRACLANNCPNYGIGRPMKATREAIVGLLKAVELYVRQDFDAEMRAWEAKKDALVERLSSLPCISVDGTPAVHPGAPGSFYLPAVCVALDEAALNLTTDEVVRQLRAGDPAIAVDRSPTGIMLRVHLLEDGEERLVAARLREILSPGRLGFDAEVGREYV